MLRVTKPNNKAVAWKIVAFPFNFYKEKSMVTKKSTQEISYWNDMAVTIRIYELRLWIFASSERPQISRGPMAMSMEILYDVYIETIR